MGILKTGILAGVLVTGMNASADNHEINLQGIADFFSKISVAPTETKEVAKIKTTTGTDFSPKTEIARKVGKNTEKEALDFWGATIKSWFETDKVERKAILVDMAQEVKKETAIELSIKAIEKELQIEEDEPTHMWKQNEFTIYDDDGNKEFIVNFNNDGRYEGEWIKFRKDGSVLYKTNYANGERDGMYEAYDALGNLVDKKQYKNGEVIEDLVMTL